MALQYSASNSVNLGTAINALASGSSSQSDVVTTGSSSNVTDTLIHAEIAVGAIAPSASTFVSVYAFGSEDGVSFPGCASGNEVLGTGNGAVTLSAFGNNLVFVGTVMAHTASVTIKSKPMSLASAFGGVMPRKWGLVFQNNTGAVLGSGSVAKYSEAYYN